MEILNSIFINFAPTKTNPYERFRYVTHKMNIPILFRMKKAVHI